MTREKQVNKAAFDYADTLELSENRFDYEDIEFAFQRGAEWADNHPINVWHDASEIPQEECPIVCINECNKLYVGNIHLGNEPNDYWYGKPTVWNNNHLQTQWHFVQKWAYISDLLPSE